jgi:hydroxyacylglutathione hydrolase
MELDEKMNDKPLPEIENWFEIKLIADKVWRINDHDNDNIYLVEGDEKALLIDTGIGTGDLAKYVKTITQLPVIVVNTHGHPDHMGGNFQFLKVYAHPLDFELIKYFSSEDKSTFEVPSLEPIRAGDEFDLGHRKLEVIEVPGHTKGSIVLLDAENKLLFAGDNNNALVWLFLDECLPLEIYLQTLQKLNERAGEFNSILPGHGDVLEKSFINEQIICAQKIISGECQGEKYETFAGSGLLYSYKRASIAYNPDNIYIR